MAGTCHGEERNGRAYERQRQVPLRGPWRSQQEADRQCAPGEARIDETGRRPRGARSGDAVDNDVVHHRLVVDRLGQNEQVGPACGRTSEKSRSSGTSWAEAPSGQGCGPRRRELPRSSGSPSSGLRCPALPLKTYVSRCGRRRWIRPPRRASSPKPSDRRTAERKRACSIDMLNPTVLSLMNSVGDGARQSPAIVSDGGRMREGADRPAGADRRPARIARDEHRHSRSARLS